ncbi:MAG: ribbon-helix-helix protein, CopG family [Selenomonadaceae bacterium]|nr:ribbon-helix-helix protein, CopG family [Selenomonadaceae bacterium]
MNNKLVITKKLRGEDGYKVFSIRIKDETIEKINDLSKQTGRTRNELIGMLLDFALEHSEVASER